MKQILTLNQIEVHNWQKFLGLRYDWQHRIPPMIGASLALATLAQEVP